VSTAEEDVPRTRPSKDSPSEILSMPHPKRILKKIELLRLTSSPNYTSRCNTALDVEFTPESSRSDPIKTEKSEPPHKEFKETLPERQSELKIRNESDLKHINI
jgi:hypothetical protein